MTEATTAQRRDLIVGSPQAKRAALASWLGGSLEYYDFYIYGTAAALVFGEVFFSKTDPATATLLALATFGIAYLARPLGALIFGHMGDRHGRKLVLNATIVLMGSATFLVGCLPSYDTIGVAAPALLVFLRILQGLSAGAETSSAATNSLEQAPERRRGLYTSWTVNGVATGFLLAALVFVPVQALPHEAMVTWGWRLPFLFSIVVLAVSYYIRKRLEEPEVFVAEKNEQQLAKVPVISLFRSHPLSVLRVAVCSLFTVTGPIVSIYGLAFAKLSGVNPSVVLVATVLANVFALAAQPLLGRLSDSIGRKPVFIAGALVSAASIFLYLYAVSSGDVPLIFAAAFCMTSLGSSGLSAAYPTFFSEMFPTRIRITGMALSLQLGLLAGGFAPAIAGILVGVDKNAWLPVAVLVAIACVLAAISAATARETYMTPTAELGLYRPLDSTSVTR